MFDATMWAFVALLIFIGVIVYFKVPAMITKGLDARADKIRNELEEARRLREEAQELLAEYQRKSKEAEEQASSIVDAAKREADAIAEDAKVKSEEYITRRTAMAEQKIAQAQNDAVSEVRGRAVDIAVAAAEKLMAEKATGKTATDLFKSSLDDIKTRLN